MVTLPEELIHLMTEWHTVPVATTGPDGKPNVAGKPVMVMNPKNHYPERTLFQANV
jgi:hypothetical protein